MSFQLYNPFETAVSSNVLSFMLTPDGPIRISTRLSDEVAKI